MKKLYITLLLAMAAITSTQAQIAEVKVNLAMGAIAIVNTSYEMGFGEGTHSSLTFDYVGAFAEENYMGTGHPFVISMGLFGYRYYLRDDHQGFFFGADAGLDAFRMNKEISITVNDPYNRYDVGYGYILGTTLGYKYRFNERWSAEASFSFGYQNCRHEGYDDEGVRLFDLNTSAEWIPYKGGIYLSYNILSRRKK
ncbi:MAG: DUF3575 domain-containing protein [Rikenellaceae bacterium]